MKTLSGLQYWIWLSSLRGIPSLKIIALAEHFGTADAVFHAVEADWMQACELSPAELEILAARSLDHAEWVLEQCERARVRVMTIRDAHYPPALRNIIDPPLCLYYKGYLPFWDKQPILSVVGTRRPSAYGELVTARICGKLAAGGFLIVSGMASGLDGTAHRAALQAAKPTFAILGCGCDVVYPAEHTGLYRDILAAGGVLSEYPPGTRPNGSHFPRRNRILSGIADAVLVTEAPRGSGALITARNAAEQGRTVFAVPGAVNAPQSEGTNALIREGATLCRNAADIFEEYADRYDLQPDVRAAMPPASASPPSTPVSPGTKPPPAVSAVPPPDRIAQCTPDQQKILACLVDGPQTADHIIAQTGFASSVVLAALSMLELDGTCENIGGNRFRICAV